ncbi:MAG: hypothetical protein AAF728_16565 [Cyanobacteria bacterium P01_D01_bin.128]
MDFLMASVMMMAIAPEPIDPASISKGADAARPSIERAEPQSAEPPSSESVQLEQSAPRVGQGPISCPPGQFASAFSDVYPTDWAYEAVNRLSSRPVECFDLPD